MAVEKKKDRKALDSLLRLKNQEIAQLKEQIAEQEDKTTKLEVDVASWSMIANVRLKEADIFKDQTHRAFKYLEEIRSIDVSPSPIASDRPGFNTVQESDMETNRRSSAWWNELYKIRNEIELHIDE